MWKKRGLMTAGLCLCASAFVYAQTPDGQTPALETVCSGLSGAAFGLCNAYCEAQDCDVHDRPSCDQLRANFARVTGSPVFPCDPRCGDGILDPDEECETDADCPNPRSVCQRDCTCSEVPECEEPIIDADGTASPGDGIPGAVEVQCGDPVLSLQAAPNFAGLDHFDNDGNNAWTFGLGGDDLHLEDPSAGTCPTANRNAVYDNNPDFQDCVVLDYDGSLFDQQFVSCDNPCDPLMAFHDFNGNGIYDDGEDIVLDVNGNGIYD